MKCPQCNSYNTRKGIDLTLGTPMGCCVWCGNIWELSPEDAKNAPCEVIVDEVNPAISTAK